MRVFHFVNEEYGLEDLHKRRLKVATLNELNDPFEFFGVDLGDEGLRRAFRVIWSTHLVGWLDPVATAPGSVPGR